jgi:hypothetical protein
MAIMMAIAPRCRIGPRDKVQVSAMRRRACERTFVTRTSGSRPRGFHGSLERGAHALREPPAQAPTGPRERKIRDGGKPALVGPESEQEMCDAIA